MARIDSLFEKLLECGGSDLHVSSGRVPMVRQSGDMVPMDYPVLNGEDIGNLFAEIMPERNRREFLETNDTDFAYECPGLSARLRANVFQDRLGMGGVFRVIPSKIVTAEELNLPGAVMDLCNLSKGLVLVTGPTGSGKSTTLAALIDLVNRTRAAHIVTIEDPIEFVHQGKKCLINQREVHTHTGSFASALRAALREDPNIVLVGEMRDLETIEIAIETAETGHLVFGTLHTNTAAGTVNRIIDSFPANRQNQIRSMLASSLKAAICQVLCKRKPKGRVAALEVLVINNGVSCLIRDAKTHQIPSAMQIGGAQGMLLLNDSLVELVRSGTVEPEEAYAKAIDKSDLLDRLRKAGIAAPAPCESRAPSTPVLKPVSPAPAARIGPAQESGSEHCVELCGHKFACVPLREADVSDASSVYAILAMGKSKGECRVVDVLLAAEAKAEENVGERVDRWFAECPGGDIWVGRCSMPDGRFTAADRIAVQERVRHESRLNI